MWVAVAVGLAWIAVAMVVFLGDDDDVLPPRRPVEVTAGTDGCRPQSLAVEPGERIVLRVTNSTDSDFEVIVTGEAGVALRTSEGYDPDRPVGSSAPGGIVPIAAGRGYSSPAKILPVAAGPAGRAAPPDPQATGILAHEGHEDEAGPNATADFRFRMIVAENGVRIMPVTFPEIGEFAPLTRFLCAAIGSDGSLNQAMPVGRITVVGQSG